MGAIPKSDARCSFRPANAAVHSDEQPNVFRVAIGDHRIVSCDEGKVTFLDRRVGSNRLRKMTLDALQFIRRFLQHVLPAGFEKVRHYGFLSPNSRTAIEAVRWLVTLHNRATFVTGSHTGQGSKTILSPRCAPCGSRLLILGFRASARSRLGLRHELTLWSR